MMIYEKLFIGTMVYVNRLNSVNRHFLLIISQKKITGYFKSFFLKTKTEFRGPERLLDSEHYRQDHQNLGSFFNSQSTTYK